MGTHLMKPVWLAILFVTVTCVSCDSTPPVARQAPVVDEVMLSDLVANPQRFHGLRIRLKGMCRVEFEGTALYQNSDAYRQRRDAEAVWLSVGWPVAPGLGALDGQEVTIEGTFDSAKKGHLAAYVGSLIDIKDINGIAISVGD